MNSGLCISFFFFFIFFFFFFNLLYFIYFWLCWVFGAAHGPSLVEASGLYFGCSAGLLIAVTSLVVEHGL